MQSRSDIASDFSSSSSGGGGGTEAPEGEVNANNGSLAI